MQSLSAQAGELQLSLLSSVSYQGSAFFQTEVMALGKLATKKCVSMHPVHMHGDHLTLHLCAISWEEDGLVLPVPAHGLSALLGIWPLHQDLQCKKCQRA